MEHTSEKEAVKIEKKWVHKSLITIAILILILVIFQAGVFVGYKKAGFMGGQFMHDDMPGGHGVAGKVVKIDIPTFIIEGPDNVEKIILTEPGTIVRKMRESLTPQDIRLDDEVIVLGSPDQKGTIEAKLIRIR